jgi:hypothetical protein
MIALSYTLFYFVSAILIARVKSISSGFGLIISSLLSSIASDVGIPANNWLTERHLHQFAFVRLQLLLFLQLFLFEYYLELKLLPPLLCFLYFLYFL